MENTSSRWEWRTFGDGFGGAEERLEALTPDRRRESDEIYILSAVSDDNIKIRDMLMDVKTLQQVNEDGLEQWKPVMKASFPLPVEEIVKVFGALRIVPQPFHRDAYTLQQFIGEQVKVSRHLRAIDVRKQRTGYLINGCIAEVANVSVECVNTRTVAIEAADPVRVMATVRQLGLGRFSNINYVRELKSLVHMSV